MKLPFQERTLSALVVVPSAIIVLILGILQYRWSTGVSETTAVRLADSLQMSMVNWQMDLFRYLSEISVALRAGPDGAADTQLYAARFAEWRDVAKYPKLVSNVYVLSGSPSPNATRLNPSAKTFEPAPWPSAFDGALGEVQRIPPTTYNIGNPVAGWWFTPSIPALFHSLGPDRGWMAVELNREELESHVLPDLAHTYFQGTEGLDYLIAVISKSGRVLYTSDPGFGSPEPPDADGTIDIFGRIAAPKAPSSVHVFHMPSDKGTSASVKINWFRLLPNTPDTDGWRLVVRHRRGGALGAFVNEIGRRDLAIGLGMMLVLVVNMGMLIVTSHRAQRLAQLQMNFVTAVSHELRTPLTVILSGADNLRNGIVESKQQVLQYGSVIGTQARQLVGLVERILLFAATRQGHHQYSLAPLAVKELIDAALTDTAGLIDAESFTVETEIAPGLPQINGDRAALSQCLQNLITNAVKYGREHRWLRIEALINERTEEVEIRVSDRGIGISATDLPHIFEPFYRSPTVRDAQIHGTGLGLPLSRSIAEAMHGRIGAESQPGKGSTFTLYLPA